MIILQIDKTAIRKMNDYFQVLDSHEPGDKIKIGYLHFSTVSNTYEPKAVFVTLAESISN